MVGKGKEKILRHGLVSNNFKFITMTDVDMPVLQFYHLILNFETKTILSTYLAYTHWVT